jgi:hypothetical protein
MRRNRETLGFQGDSLPGGYPARISAIRARFARGAS